MCQVLVKAMTDPAITPQNSPFLTNLRLIKLLMTVLPFEVRAWLLAILLYRFGLHRRRHCRGMSRIYIVGRPSDEVPRTGPTSVSRASPRQHRWFVQGKTAHDPVQRGIRPLPVQPRTLGQFRNVQQRSPSRPDPAAQTIHVHFVAPDHPVPQGLMPHAANPDPQPSASPLSTKAGGHQATRLITGLRPTRSASVHIARGWRAPHRNRGAHGRNL